MYLKETVQTKVCKTFKEGIIFPRRISFRKIIVLGFKHPLVKNVVTDKGAQVPRQGEKCSLCLSWARPAPQHSWKSDSQPLTLAVHLW